MNPSPIIASLDQTSSSHLIPLKSSYWSLDDMHMRINYGFDLRSTPWAAFFMNQQEVCDVVKFFLYLIFLTDQTD